MNNYDNFKVFSSSDEAEIWAKKYYREWIAVSRHGVTHCENSVHNLFFALTGNMHEIYNNVLRFLNRGLKIYGTPDTNGYLCEIVSMSDEISKHRVPENITVFRYTRKRHFCELFDSKEPQVGDIGTDPSFVSTTLVRDLLKEFALQHRYNCLLKIYVPKGSAGIYINWGDLSTLNEQEILFPPNTTFKIIRKSHNIFKPYYECLLLQE